MDFDKPSVLKLPIILREIEVARVETISPTLQRVWFTGDQLGAFTKDGRDLPRFRSEGPDDHVKFFFPSPVDGVLSLPVQADGTIDWPRDPRPVARDYTPRGFTDGDSEVAFDFVLHGHGVASVWAAGARPGDRLHMAGPKASLLVPDAGHFVLLADQTALPALCNWLEKLPTGTRVDALVWVDEEQSRIAIETKAEANIVWVVDPAPDGAALLDAMRGFGRPGGNSFVWGAMEAGVLRKVRAYYLDECGLDRGQTDLSAYWRRGVDDDQLLAEAFRLKAMADLEKPFLVRAAVQFRLPELVGEGADTIETLAARAAINPDALRRMMPVFVDLGIFRRNGERLSLGLAGDLLTSAYRRALFSAETAQGRLHLAARGLPHMLRTGESAYRAAFGTELEEDVANDGALAESLGHELGHMVEALVESTLEPLCAACGKTVTVLGTGAEAVLMTILQADGERTGTAVVPGWARAEAKEHVEEAGLSGRARVMLSADGPTPETLVISAMGELWTDAAIEDAVDSAAADSVWLIELVARPESPEIAEDATLIDIGFGIRPSAPENLAERLGELGFSAAGTHSTRTGLRLTRFARTG